MDNAARAPVLDAPSTTTGTASGASSTSATVTQGQLQLTAITPDGGFSQVSFSDSGTATPRYLKVCPISEKQPPCWGCTGYRHSDGI
ncbi:hypothetical protein IVY21_11735 [Salmonella enterica subsp. enterica serovar Worthington]|nr:hypothetical protein [Salmonella enterica subsp. enterica serovar Worthington]